MERDFVKEHEEYAAAHLKGMTDLERLILAGYDHDERTAILAASEKYGVSVDVIMAAMVRTLQKQDKLVEMAEALAADPGNGPGTPNRAARRAAAKAARKEPRKP